MSASARVLAGGAMLILAACHLRPLQPELPPAAEAPPPVLRFEEAGWDDLPGWNMDDIASAWPALLASCSSPRMAPAWAAFCAAALEISAADTAAQRALIQERLRPWRITTISQEGRRQRSNQGMVTGYYEPVVNGSRTRGGAYQTPLYGVPEDLVTVELGELYPELKGERIRGQLQGRRVTPYPDRARLADGKLLAGREIVWLEDAVDAFFLQVQGSGRVRLADGGMLRLAYADVNGQPYRSIGRYLVDQGEMALDEVTMPSLRRWLAAHPERQDEVFNANPSVVFFREEQLGDPTLGPRGALGVPLVAGRSLAIDPRQLPLGAPLYLATTHPLTHQPLARLMLGQDTGGAIRGALRADFFWGMGAQAGEAAGAMREQGSLWLLWPADQAPPVPTS